MAFGGWSRYDAIEPSLAAPTEANIIVSMSTVALCEETGKRPTTTDGMPTVYERCAREELTAVCGPSSM
jgi:hypothetical protein